MAKASEAKSKKPAGKTSTKTYYNYIGGEWIKSASGEWFENINPADTGDVVGRFPLSVEEDVNRAVEAAKSAATKWRRTPAPNAPKFFSRWAKSCAKTKTATRAR